MHTLRIFRKLLFNCFLLIFINQEMYGQLSPEKITELDFMKKDNRVLSFNWNKAKKKGSGILKEKYVFQARSWINNEEYGSEIVFMTLFAEKDILGNQRGSQQFLSYINKEIINLASICLLDKEILNAINKEIIQKKGKINLQQSTYLLLTETDKYLDISVSVENFDFGADRITINFRASNE